MLNSERYKLGHLHSFLFQWVLNEVIGDLRHTKLLNNLDLVDTLPLPVFKFHDHGYRCGWRDLLDRVGRVRHLLRKLNVVDLLLKCYSFN